MGAPSVGPQATDESRTTFEMEYRPEWISTFLEVNSRPNYQEGRRIGSGHCPATSQRENTPRPPFQSEQQLRNSLEERERPADLHDGLIQSICGRAELRTANVS